ncbi:aromatic ring-hydroxylating oxygenase subunit alpha [Paraburkholderia sp. ZP32-5]|uniref:aromatic ring-hydroxylating oxygenase subunit alpha n=1 Tax=Paraburkholderia sp. ZP32-5 TaxID=2883245 RepID=UPI001F42BBB3|nr:aromatic ring-hydroxylating dioxygenase subunit alpha [Paraburkholderia sp. ZP32-5]
MGREGRYIIDDAERKVFKLNREVHVSEDLLREEVAKIFSKCWIYVGHASEIPKPGDFVTRRVAGRPVIFCRDGKGNVQCLFNTCRHRGATVCTERAGNTRRFFCVYHGWSYGNDGSLARIPGDDAYDEGFEKSEYALKRPARFESYRDLWFMCLDADAVSLTDYLGAAVMDYIDLVFEQSPSGQMQVITGSQEYDVEANWKLMVENSVDDYHLPTTHSTWLNFMKNSGVDIEPPREAGLVLPTKGYAIDLGNGHFTTDNVNFRGRPVARWIPLYGEEAKEEIESIRAELVARLGEERAARVADTNRNLVIFPNLVINDGSSVTIRTFYPDGPARMQVTAWAAGPVEESESARARRLDAFLTFYGPGGFATPDDVEALELVQQGLANWQDDPWSEMSRGLNKSESEQLNSDEHHLRTFWRRWNELMTGSAQ